jgi:hypothetical protein
MSLYIIQLIVLLLPIDYRCRKSFLEFKTERKIHPDRLERESVGWEDVEPRGWSARE